MNLKNVEEELLSQYADIAISDGQITLQDFSKYLGIPESEPALIDLFKLYDKVRDTGKKNLHAWKHPPLTPPYTCTHTHTHTVKPQNLNTFKQ